MQFREGAFLTIARMAQACRCLSRKAVSHNMLGAPINNSRKTAKASGKICMHGQPCNQLRPSRPYGVGKEARASSAWWSKEQVQASWIWWGGEPSQPLQISVHQWALWSPEVFQATVGFYVPMGPEMCAYIPLPWGTPTLPILDSTFLTTHEID